MKISKQDLEMADDVYGAILTQTPTVHRLTIWSLAALFIQLSLRLPVVC